MKLYRWYSDYLANYSRGSIIVMASSVKKARAMALEMWFMEYGKDYASDDEWFAEKKAKFVDDIEKEPYDVTNGVIFISGSD